MQSGREQGKVEILMPCQTMDPAKGSFMVHPLAVKKSSGVTKSIPNPYFDPYDHKSERRLPVFRAANHITHSLRGLVAEPHYGAFDFAVYYNRRV